MKNKWHWSAKLAGGTAIAAVIIITILTILAFHSEAGVSQPGVPLKRGTAGQVKFAQVGDTAQVYVSPGGDSIIVWPGGVTGKGVTMSIQNDTLYFGNATDDDYVTILFCSTNDSAGLRYNTVSNKLEFSHNLATWAEVGSGGGAGSGTEDTLIVNVSGTQYSIISNLIKFKVGTGITFTRQDSTTYDVILINSSLGTNIEDAEVDDGITITRANDVDTTGTRIAVALTNRVKVTVLNDTLTVLRTEALRNAKVTGTAQIEGAIAGFHGTGKDTIKSATTFLPVMWPNGVIYARKLVPFAAAAATASDSLLAYIGIDGSYNLVLFDDANGVKTLADVMAFSDSANNITDLGVDAADIGTAAWEAITDTAQAMTTRGSKSGITVTCTDAGNIIDYSVNVDNTTVEKVSGTTNLRVKDDGITEPKIGANNAAVHSYVLGYNKPDETGTLQWYAPSTFRDVYVYPQFIAGAGSAGPGDSVRLELPSHDGGTPILCKDSSVNTGAGPFTDTLYAVFNLPSWASQVDTFYLTIKGKSATNDTAEVTGIEIWGPNKTTPSLVADSVYYTETTDRNTATVARYTYTVANTQFDGGDQLSVRIITVLGASTNGVIYFYKLKLRVS